MSIANDLMTANDRITTAVDRFRATPQVLPLPEGVYLAALKPNRQSPRIINGVTFPATQISSIPQPGTVAPSILHKGNLTACAWISGADIAVITIPAGGSPLLITNYVYGPELQQCQDLDITRLGGPQQAPSVGLVLYAHIQQIGEQRFAAGEWAATDAPFWIEALRLEVTPTVGKLLQYRVPGVSTTDGAWTAAPGRLGTPGGAPLLGVAFRLLPPLAESHRVVYAGRFLRHGEVMAADGEPCRSPQSQDPLIAVRVAIVPR
ncbi:hypothetical protein [Niveispirillum sp.]|uniref:hypothetical protein n=1 Tax=Niveispirillum sp. TaxID=1917217 RepID=UPI001B75D583|nr:hypothetical protein [Niveispirillum sp.]MBP7334718.1 hypothetical protein [Niveispirillum sp.]